LDDPWIRDWLERTVLDILLDFLSEEEFANIFAANATTMNDAEKLQSDEK